MVRLPVLSMGEIEPDGLTRIPSVKTAVVRVSVLGKDEIEELPISFASTQGIEVESKQPSRSVNDPEEKRGSDVRKTPLSDRNRLSLLSLRAPITYTCCTHNPDKNHTRSHAQAARDIRGRR